MNNTTPAKTVPIDLPLPSTKQLPPFNKPITDADRRAARAAIEAEHAGDDGAIFRFISGGTK